MKILYISKSTIPSDTANSINVMKMCEAFALLGNEVDLVVPQHSFENLGIYNPYEFYGVKKTFSIQRIRNIKKVRESNQHYNKLFKTYIKLKHPDLVFARCNSLKYSLDELSIPIILEIHKIVTIKDNKKLKILLKSGYLKRIVFKNSYLRKYYLENYDIPLNLIIVSANGADEFKSNEKLLLPHTSKIRVGYIGHLYSGKGMEIISKMITNCPWAEFHIVGGTEVDLNFWKEKLNIYTNVFFHGFVPHSQIYKYSNSFDVLLAPYLEEVSSAGGGKQKLNWLSPLKIFEYMAAGKAIIASNSPALTEILTNKVDSVLCKSNNENEWIDALLYLKENPDYREALGRNAKEEFLKKYTWKSRAKHNLENLNLQN